ncbi:1-deoxy-D-xylulose-5-phosphate reductoisomerase [Alkaliphilus peptidifermentans]|uniref:1-deoxy-D-xylulose 5-phosphate reductoisomerase n=1 Tax=Alkaliphilus peptidifermentans DSM 18978 TaxID=1120976 RepID=A0A1G5DDH2_9FIRM|nr:1-deoxy-D-xylulose-5-phosphate reductoisomerase [Alkaliphilus peptidifermentans]SCY12813.1 1-deoxy-D-xylulose 5-phosphate reductoisomerase [Alkaliphilus peptidifermentans DSM 18978]
MKKKIVILGSTGSIGKQALDVVSNLSDSFEVVGLAVMRNIAELQEQINIYKPKVVVVYDKVKADILKSRIPSNIRVLSGMEGLIEIATMEECEIVVNSVVGSIGLLPTLSAIRCGKTIALANKETLVVGGSLIMEEARKNNVKILPVDSEHSAIFQCLQGESSKNISKIILTASGGPFREWDKESLINAKFHEALKHPNWDMGRKISIDSSTLMNKGLEVIEAKWLFDVDLDKIEVIIHPQSIIHSMVEFVDGSIIAQLGAPDMRLPIQYSLAYPERITGDNTKLNLKELSRLDFMQPDTEKFPCLQLAYEALRIGGTMPCVINGANEVLVEKYLAEEIKFYDIPKYIEKAMKAHKSFQYNTIEEVLEVDKWVREWLKTEI